jgi:formylglycine-generating enzyme required for sulfatase activity
MKPLSTAAMLCAAAVLLASLTGCPQPNNPVVSFDIDNRMGEAPLTVAFTDQSKPKQADVTITSRLWEFGDGQTSTGQNPTHTYTEPGLYSVKLTVTNSAGNTTSQTYLNSITALDAVRIEGESAGEVRTFDGIEFVWIPAGTFMMGDSDPTYPETDALPVHEVTLTRGYWISRSEITQQQWHDVLGEKPSFFDIYPDLYPVESVSWYDAQRFVTALNDANTGNGLYRLPTEAEWERACRANTNTLFSFGDDDSVFWQYGWSLRTAPYAPQVTGYLNPNPWGLLDVHGNVAEWVQDYYTYSYGADPVTDPLGPVWAPYGTTRGGSHRDPVWSCTSASRTPFVRSAKYSFLGLRIVRQ